MINDEADKVIENLFELLKTIYQNKLELIGCREFVFDYVHSLCYKCHKIKKIHAGSYIDSSHWIKIKKATINPIYKKHNKCFQYAVTVALNHEQLGKYPKRIKKIKPLINKYNWKEINFTSKEDDWKKIEKNNVIIALNVLYTKKEKIYPAYVSKHNSEREKQVIFLMIPNAEGWHYLVVKTYQHY